jgi:hypothetical protein
VHTARAELDRAVRQATAAARALDQLQRQRDRADG